MVGNQAKCKAVVLSATTPQYVLVGGVAIRLNSRLQRNMELRHGCTNPVGQFAMMTKFVYVSPNVYEFSEWNCLKSLLWRLEFWGDS
jgi:hypothetical protein